jgi:integrase
LELGVGKLRLRAVDGCPRPQTPTQEQVTAFAESLKTMRMVKGKTVPKSQKVLMNEARKKLRHKMARSHANKFALYDYRHSWCHRFLTNGGDPVTAATLMGHRDLTMLHRVYGHLLKAPTHLREQLQKAAG